MDVSQELDVLNAGLTVHNKIDIHILPDRRVKLARLLRPGCKGGRGDQEDGSEDREGRSNQGW